MSKLEDHEDHLERLAFAEQRARSRDIPQPSRAKAAAKPPVLDLDPQHRGRSVDAIADKAERVAVAEQDANRAKSRLRRAVLKVERQAGDGAELGGTGQTILKRRETPLQRLLNAKRIGPEELRAAEDIDHAFSATTLASACKSPTLERRDSSYGGLESPRAVDAVLRYRIWANLWTKRAKLGDPTLQIIIAAIVDGQPFREIEIELGLRHGAASRATAAGLRDYAARAGWAQGPAVQRWLVGEGAVFRLKRRRPLETMRSLARRWDREVAA